MKHSDSIIEIVAALVKVQADLKPIPRSGVNPHFKSQYLTLADVMDAARPLLVANGISVHQSTADEDDAGFAVETMLAHISGQWIMGRVRMPMGKATAQEAGSGISYGRRYGLAAMLGVVADEDDDGNAATTAQRTGGATSRPSTSTGRPSGSNAPAASSRPSTTGTLAAPGTSVLMPGLPTWFRNMAGQPIQDVPGTILGEAESYYAKKVNAGGKYADTNKECLSTIQAEIARRDTLIPDDGDPGPSEY